MAFMVRDKLDRRKHVFADWSFVEPGYAVSWSDRLETEWETPRGIQLKVQTPHIRPDPLVEIENPWETSYTLHTTIMEAEGCYRLYYTCYNQLSSDSKSEAQQNQYSYFLCYAESVDGINWNKPNIGKVNWRGSSDNNIVYGMDRSLGRPVPTATVFKDNNAPDKEKYKIIHRGERKDGTRCVFGATSPDGLDWTAIEKPLIPDYFTDSQIVASFDERIGKYRGYFRGWTKETRGSYHGRRTIAYAETEDFTNWPIPETIVTTDAYDHPGTDIYTNGFAEWPDTDAYLMFPGFYHREIDIPQIHLMTSRNGINWERHTRDPIIGGIGPGLSRDPRLDPTGGFYAGAGIISTRPDESSISIIPCRRSHNNNRNGTGEGDIIESHQQGFYPSITGGYAAQISLATWRKDGFVCLEAEEDGSFTTTPFTFTGSKLKLNGWSRYRGGIQVEIADSTNEKHSFSEIIAGRGFNDSDEISGSHIDHTVTWNGESDVSKWNGKTVRLRFKMRRARLYSLWFE